MSLPLTYHARTPSTGIPSRRYLLSPHQPKTILFTRNHKPFRASASASASAITSSNNETVPKSAIQRIAEKLRSLGFTEESRRSNNALIDDDSKIGEIFIPNSQHLPKYRVGHTFDQSWSTPQNPVPDPGTGRAITKLHELRNEVVREKRELKEKEKREKRAPTLAELKMPADEVRRLTTIGIKLKKKLKIGKAGITEGIVNGIHERWRRSEVVKIACEDICKMNMKRTHDLLEADKVSSAVAKVVRQRDMVISDRDVEIAWLDSKLEALGVEHREDVAALESILASMEVENVSLKAEVARLKEENEGVKGRLDQLAGQMATLENDLSLRIRPHEVADMMLSRLWEGINISRRIVRLVDLDLWISSICQTSQRSVAIASGQTGATAAFVVFGDCSFLFFLV